MMDMNELLIGKHYRILINGELIPADMLTWSKWFEDIDNRRIGYDEFEGGYISTVCLGMNHRFTEMPLWFETMIFGGEHDQYLERYATLAEAQEGHKRAVQMVKGNDP